MLPLIYKEKVIGYVPELPWDKYPYDAVIASETVPYVWRIVTNEQVDILVDNKVISYCEGCEDSTYHLRNNKSWSDVSALIGSQKTGA
jgi:hypothetical protein